MKSKFQHMEWERGSARCWDSFVVFKGGVPRSFLLGDVKLTLDCTILVTAPFWLSTGAASRPTVDKGVARIRSGDGYHRRTGIWSHVWVVIVNMKCRSSSPWPDCLHATSMIWSVWHRLHLCAVGGPPFFSACVCLAAGSLVDDIGMPACSWQVISLRLRLKLSPRLLYSVIKDLSLG
jgi:hypothetical protein